MSCLFSIFISDLCKKPFFDYFEIVGQPEVENASIKIFLAVHSYGNGTMVFSGHIFWCRVLSLWLKDILKNRNLHFSMDKNINYVLCVGPLYKEGSNSLDSNMIYVQNIMTFQ